MTDSHLNSVHLEASRRDDFRRARQALLEALGLHTVPERRGGSAGGRSHTMAHVRHEQSTADTDYWLRDREQIYPLKTGLNTIGRLPDNDVVIQGPFVSRRHCAILLHAGGGCQFYDLASTNGAYVNGVKVNGSTQLVSGDEIWMCQRSLVFLSKDRNIHLAKENTHAGAGARTAQ